MESEDIIRAGGAVFKVWGPVITSLEEGGVGGEGGGDWPFSLCGCLELSDY